jgi:hypothetical protein
MASEKITPLEPRAFFTGIWKGNGELCPHRFLRWLFPKEQFSFLSKPTWLSENFWIVSEQLKFKSGDTIDRKMFVEITGPGRLHASADDMPLGADITLRENGFYFTPYYILARYKGIRWRLRCIDENVVDEDGLIHDTIKMFFCNFHVATIRLQATVERKDI